jgi:exodeoxyribonuclease VII small subunit
MNGDAQKTLTLSDFLSQSNENSQLIKNLTFESGLKLLEELVSKVESGSLTLDATMSAYEKGTFLFQKLKGQLSQAEEKFKVLQKGGAS